MFIKWRGKVKGKNPEEDTIPNIINRVVAGPLFNIMDYKIPTSPVVQQ